MGVPGTTFVCSGITYEWQDCCSCAVVFAAPIRLFNARRASKEIFYCPNGHRMAWSESEADRLRRERDNLRQQMARVEDERAAALRVAEDERQARVKAERAAARVRKRINAGVCPDCNRTFANLARHMACKHTPPKPKLAALGGAA